MIVTCEACFTCFNLSDELIKPSGSRVRCSKCKKVFSVYPPIAEEPPLSLPTENSDINLEFPSSSPFLEFSQPNEHEARNITTSDYPSETPSFPNKYLDMTEYDFTEIDKLIHSDKSGETENDLLIHPGDLPPEPSLSGIEPAEAQFHSEELDKLLKTDLSELSLDQPEFMDRLDHLSTDLKALPSDISFENQIDAMNLALDSKTEFSESKPLEVSLDEFEKSLEMNFADISLISPVDEEAVSDQEKVLAEKGQIAKEDLFSKDELSGFNDIEDLDLSDIETFLEERDTGRLKTSLADGTENFKRSDSGIAYASSALEADKTLEMEDPYLTFDELRLDKDETESATLLEVKESFSPAIETPEPPSVISHQKEFKIQNTESGNEENPLPADMVVEEELDEAQPEPKKGISPLIIVALILAVIAGLVYGGYILLNSMGIPIPFISNPAPSKVQDPGNFKIKPFDISSKFVDNTKIGKFFIVTGKVKNEYPTARGTIQVIGKLYTKDKTMAKEETVFCGNILSDIDLANADLSTIQERLQNRSGDNGANLKVAPGDAISFMTVFSNLPDNLEEFTLEVKSSVQK